MKGFSAAILAATFVFALAADLHPQQAKAEGTVESVDFMGETVVIRLPGGETVEVAVGEETEIFFEKEKTTLDTIEYGENIWASYSKDDGRNVAVRIIITPPLEEDSAKMPPQIM